MFGTPGLTSGSYPHDHTLLAGTVSDQTRAQLEKFGCSFEPVPGSNALRIRLPRGWSTRLSAANATGDIFTIAAYDRKDYKRVEWGFHAYLQSKLPEDSYPGLSSPAYFRAFYIVAIPRFSAQPDWRAGRYYIFDYLAGSIAASDLTETQAEQWLTDNQEDWPEEPTRTRQWWNPLTWFC
jgi:hypothetical protein